jgi:DNA polymerase III delta prime subunit
MNRLSGNAFLIAGGVDDLPQVLNLLRNEGIATQANPDLYVRSYRQFGIDDAHELRGRASSRAVGERRVFVIAASGMTSEAQNALLKTLEEPPANALFIFLVPAPETLLSTVRSRSQMLVLEGLGTPAKKDSIDASAFFAAPAAKRIEMLKVVLEKDDDDKYDTGAILAFLASLERHAARMKDKAAMKNVLDTIYRARMYIADRGALVKTLLESVALLSP